MEETLFPGTPPDTHVHSGVVVWKGESLHTAWAVYSAGKETGQNEFVLTRKK